MEQQIDVSKLTKEQLKQAIAELDKKDQADREAYQSMKHEMVNTLCNEADFLQGLLMRFHQKAMAELTAFRGVMNQYGDLPANSKGGFSITNADDTFRCRLKFQNLGDFDEKAEIAESHIRSFFERTLMKTDKNSYELVMKLLERKKGKLEYSRVMEILSFEERYDDEGWKKACQLLKESFHHTGTKNYLEFEQKDDNGVWKKINLNLSAL